MPARTYQTLKPLGLQKLPIHLNLMKYLFVLLLLSPAVLFSQKQADNWYFGNLAGLNFSSGNPLALSNGKTYTVEGVATISDRNGDLLFYTDGITVWNKTHQVMQNGYNLYGHPSSTQSAIIVPQPGNDSIYYIFTTTAYGQHNGLRYSTVNMKGAAGLGAIVQKNIPLITPVGEKVTAVNHCNKRDIWVVSRQFNGNNYYAWLVTPSGISASPVTSPTGNYIGDPFNGGSDAIGYLKISPDGKKIAAAHNYYQFCELGKFDNSTGIVSNVIKVSSIPPIPSLAIAIKVVPAPYGVEFSPDSRLLYLDLGLRVYMTDLINLTYDMTTLNQYNITVHDSTLIAQSHYFVDSISYIPTSDLENALQLANNKKIYKTHHTKNKLSVINNPNVQGAGCLYVQNAIDLGSGISQIGLPSFVTSYFNTFDFQSSGDCNSSTLQFQFDNPGYIDSVKWDFGDPASATNNYSNLFNPTHTFSTGGMFTVKLYCYYTSGCGQFKDSVEKTIMASAPDINLGIDTTICTGDSLVLSAGNMGSIYIWNTGSTNDSIVVTEPGTYWVTTTLNGCTSSDTIRIANYPLPQFSLGNDTLICNNLPLQLAPAPSIPGATYLWSTSENSPVITTSTAGNYWLQITDINGCRGRDTISIDFKQLPDYSLGNDTAICQKDSVLFNATISGADSYLWNTAQTSPIITVQQTGIYWCDVSIDGCTYRDSISLIVNPLPIIRFNTDTTLCEGHTLLLDATNPNATYLWQDGSAQSTFLVSMQGRYSVKVIMEGCESYGEINVAYTLKPHFTLGADRPICNGELITLQPVLDTSWTLKWQDGSTQPSLLISQPGSYMLRASNTCGTTADTIMISKGQCEVRVPNAFTPNGDGINNTFRALGVDDVTQFKLTVYNRYGQVIFQTKDKYSGWNGKIHSRDADVGVYLYVIQYTNRGDNIPTTLKGTFTLLR